MNPEGKNLNGVQAEMDIKWVKQLRKKLFVL